MFKELLNAKTIVIKEKGYISSEYGVEELEEIYNELINLINSPK